MSQAIINADGTSGFDYKVQHRDPKTGRVIRINPYTLHIRKGRHFLERPKGSGNLWDPQGHACGQMTWVVAEGAKMPHKHFDTDAEHVPWTAPLTGDQKVAQELRTLQVQNADLVEKLAKQEAAANTKEAEVVAKVVAPKVTPRVAKALPVEGK